MKATNITFTGKLLGASLSAMMALSVGCSVDGPVGPGTDPDVEDPGDNPDDPDEPAPMDATGLYALDSEFDVISGMPGDVGNVVNTFVEMTDDTYDPATWLIDKIVDEIDNSTVRSFVNSTRPVLDGLVLNVIEDNAPQLVADILEIGDHFGQIAREFGTVSTLDIQRDTDSGLVATHKVSGYMFEIDNVAYEYDMAALGAEDTVVAGVSIEYAADRVTIGEHNVPIEYGGFLALALEDVIVPLVDPSADGLHDLLTNNINCADIGDTIYQEVQFLDPGFYEGLCDLGLLAGTNAILDQLYAIDSKAQVIMVINGSARASDQNNDRKVDRLTTGKWAGDISYNGNVGALAEDVNTFSGQRM